MGVKILLALVVLATGVGLWWSCKNCHKELELLPNQWWGPDQMKGRQDTTVRPFQVKFDEKMVADLKQRLKNHRPFTPALEGVGFEYGFNSGHLDSWVTYWADKYNFAEREKFLNQFPQFKTNIQGLDIHFIRVKPQVDAKTQVVPILLLHGWPGSVREFYEAIPLLTKPRPGFDFVFEVIVPSLPGYGFSDSAVRPGLGAPQTAVIMRNLMHRLNFKKFYIQGGDWGAIVAAAMATYFPDDVIGHHSNMLTVQSGCNMLKTFVGAFLPSLVVEPHLADRMYPLSSVFAYIMEEFGYFHLQATKPDTVGVALTDSPSGLLAYILEKFSTWTVRDFKSKPDGGLVSGKKFTREQLLDNLMMYWTSNSITTSMRMYAETMSAKTRALGWEHHKTTVPTWVVQTKHELFYQPESFLKTKYPNLLHTTVLDDGGHFFAFELPQVYSDDVFKAVKAFREEDKRRKESEKKTDL